MSCGMCFECDNCVVYCPQTAVFRVKKNQATLGRYVDTDYNKCIGCHICADVCPTGYIQMGLAMIVMNCGDQSAVACSLLAYLQVCLAVRWRALHLDRS